MSALLSWTQYLPDLLAGLRVAVLLTAVSLVLGYPLGLVLAMATSSQLRTARAVALVVVEVGRGLPLLVLLYIVYQGLPQLKLTPTAMVSAIAAFTWSAAAYSTEILRASRGAVTAGQTEAATAAGLNARDSFRFVVLPQATRLALPPLLNLAVQMFQITSLAYVITVPEVMQSAYFAGTRLVRLPVGVPRRRRRLRGDHAPGVGSRLPSRGSAQPAPLDAHDPAAPSIPRVEGPPMKRLAPVLAVGLGLSLLTACGSSSSGNEAAAAPAAAAASGAGASSGSGSGSGSCTPKHPGLKTITPGSLTVASYVYPPFSDMQGDKLGGAEGEIITRIAGMECLDVKVAAGDAAAMIPDIQTGRADTCIGSWYRTAARQKVVLLSAPVIADRLTLISKDGVGAVQDLKGRKVGSILGFLWNDDLKKLLGGNVKFYQTADAMYSDFAAGRIDVIVDTYPSAQSILKKKSIDGVQFKVPPADPAVVSTQKPGQTNFPVTKSNHPTWSRRSTTTSLPCARAATSSRSS